MESRKRAAVPERMGGAEKPSRGCEFPPQGPSLAGGTGDACRGWRLKPTKTTERRSSPDISSVGWLAVIWESRRG